MRRREIWREWREKPMERQRLPGGGDKTREERRRMKMRKEKRRAGAR